jgi:hypothetical protein
MPTNVEWAFAVSQLITLTLREELHWRPEPPTPEVEAFIGSDVVQYFRTSHDGRELGLFGRDGTVGWASRSGPIPRDEEAGLLLLDTDGRPLMTVPEPVSGMSELLNVARQQTAGADAFVQGLLAEA